MEWVAIALWVLVVGLALPLAAAGALTSSWLGLSALLVSAGLVFCGLYALLEGGRWMAWLSAGLALAAAAAIAMGAGRLLSDDPRSASAGQTAEEHAATLAAVELQLLLTVAFLTGLAAAGVTTVG